MTQTKIEPDPKEKVWHGKMNRLSKNCLADQKHQISISDQLALNNSFKKSLECSFHYYETLFISLHLSVALSVSTEAYLVAETLSSKMDQTE